MPRTSPCMTDLHPWLRRRVYELADLHEEAFPERSLALIWAHRTPQEQYSAYLAGRSKLAKLGKEAGLEAGAFWRRLRDGPHFQLPKKARFTACQQVLRERDFYHGKLDGIIGPRSLAAILDACDSSGINGIAKRRQLMPVTPELWSWLHLQPMDYAL